MKKRKAVFLDRDGTLVVHEHYLSSPDQLKLLPNASRGIRLFQEHGYLVIVVTNQSGIARGFFDEEQLMLIHSKLKAMLKDEGVVIDDWYFCPHHREGKIDYYRVDCDCRKPKPGMILASARKHHIDLSQSLMIGDSASDMLAGKNAGCKTMLIKHNQGDDTCITSEIGIDYCVKNLLEAAKIFTPGA
ncbi:MAG: D,D-heptose 1,7-bisphosphate phosphatase [Candidatus Brocadia sp. UTAMX1]|jgi:D-glycero-D-manno-heptose 1,7-bisphosphate phosphatase|nr:MAG: D,D-heptose 1,7-bisphosphate phosphatase [Candidatus Brocadia sp. UTAMX1]